MVTVYSGNALDFNCIKCFLVALLDSFAADWIAIAFNYSIYPEFVWYKAADESFKALTYYELCTAFFQKYAVVVMITAQLHSTKSKHRFCRGSNSARDVLKICNGEHTRHWFHLEMIWNEMKLFLVNLHNFTIISANTSEKCKELINYLKLILKK